MENDDVAFHYNRKEYLVVKRSLTVGLSLRAGDVEAVGRIVLRLLSHCCAAEVPRKALRVRRINCPVVVSISVVIIGGVATEITVIGVADLSCRVVIDGSKIVLSQQAKPVRARSLNRQIV